MIRHVYTAALALGLVAVAPVYLSRAARRGAPVALRERLGYLPDAVVAALRGRRVVWVHAVSVGEATAAAPLLREITARYPALRLFVTTVTATGRQTVLDQVPQADVAYFPFDFPSAINRVLTAVDPRLFLCVETELWPNVLFALAQRDVPSFLINARLTDRSARRYRWAGRLFRPVLAGMRGVAAQTAPDAERLASIGADPSRIVVTGNLKFDHGPGESKSESGAGREELGLAADELLWVAGSTHAGEEDQVLAAYRRLRERDPRLVLLLAPRHVDRVADVEAAVRRHDCDPIRRSALAQSDPVPASPRPRVIVLDTLGELAGLYRHAAVAFVGGTLVAVGGHNLLEPAARGTAVVFGPHTYKCEEIASALVAAGGGVQVDSVDGLTEHVGRLVMDRGLRDEMGRRGRDMVARSRGAVTRTLSMLDPWLAAC